MGGETMTYIALELAPGRVSGEHNDQKANPVF